MEGQEKEDSSGVAWRNAVVVVIFCCLIYIYCSRNKQKASGPRAPPRRHRLVERVTAEAAAAASTSTSVNSTKKARRRQKARSSVVRHLVVAPPNNISREQSEAILAQWTHDTMIFMWRLALDSRLETPAYYVPVPLLQARLAEEQRTLNLDDNDLILEYLLAPTDRVDAAPVRVDVQAAPNGGATLLTDVVVRARRAREELATIHKWRWTSVIHKNRSFLELDHAPRLPQAAVALTEAKEECEKVFDAIAMAAVRALLDRLCERSQDPGRLFRAQGYAAALAHLAVTRPEKVRVVLHDVATEAAKRETSGNTGYARAAMGPLVHDIVERIAGLLAPPREVSTAQSAVFVLRALCDASHYVTVLVSETPFFLPTDAFDPSQANVVALFEDRSLLGALCSVFVQMEPSQTQNELMEAFKNAAELQTHFVDSLAPLLRCFLKQSDDDPVDSVDSASARTRLFLYLKALFRCNLPRRRVRDHAWDSGQVSSEHTLLTLLRVILRFVQPQKEWVDLIDSRYLLPGVDGVVEMGDMVDRVGMTSSEVQAYAQEELHVPPHFGSVTELFFMAHELVTLARFRYSSALDRLQRGYSIATERVREMEARDTAQAVLERARRVRLQIHSRLMQYLVIAGSQSALQELLCLPIATSMWLLRVRGAESRTARKAVAPLPKAWAVLPNAVLYNFAGILQRVESFAPLTKEWRDRRAGSTFTVSLDGDAQATVLRGILCCLVGKFASFSTRCHGELVNLGMSVFVPPEGSVYLDTHVWNHPSILNGFSVPNDEGSRTHMSVMCVLVQTFIRLGYGRHDHGVAMYRYRDRDVVCKCLLYLFLSAHYETELVACAQGNKVDFCLFLTQLATDVVTMFDEGLDVLTKEGGGEEEEEARNREARARGVFAHAHRGLKVLYSMSRIHLLRRYFHLSDGIRAAIVSLVALYLERLVKNKRSILGVAPDIRERVGLRTRDFGARIARLMVSLSEDDSFGSDDDDDDAQKGMFLQDLVKHDSYEPALLSRFVRSVGTQKLLLDDEFKCLLLAKDRAHGFAKEAAAEEKLFADAPEHFYCPLSSALMDEPVMLPSGQVVERETIVKWLEQTPENPYNRQPLCVEEIQPATALRKEIRAWKKGRREGRR